MTAPWVELTAAVLAGVPKLPGALCTGHAELFDGDTDEAVRRAAQLCHRCPARAPCSEWADTLPHNRAHGVLAGRYREWVSHPSQLKTTTKGTP
ncbi:WhiB family transcriptional regulator [Mycobacterium marinum]|uniref:WhiB family transcriptional regulator n=1 Tax=Mycobacterium marinum TaxID=1781 RepID=UPI0023583687|nr:WhiB family transcriptional regulator [Mycobacterium marinum]WCS20123.1 WhiB family transcriptional regulator [Mycobacterium marinum]